jgi:hypothetical protein
MADYNGWTNKETWLVNLWLGANLEVDQESSIEITADYIEELVEFLLEYDIMQHGFVRDLLNCALGEVNYEEIAAHYAREEEEEEDA